MIKCGYCGKENEGGLVRCSICGMELKPAAEAPPATPHHLPEPQLIPPEIVEPALSYKDGFHRADWPAIKQWIAANISSLEADVALSEAALLWVKKLRDDLGGDYFVIESRRTILLCDQPLETARWLLDYAGRTEQTIKAQLGDVAWSGASGKDVILVFSDEDDYYEYLSHHSPDGEQATSGGVCIHSGYTHIAVPWRDENDVANAIVHELTHDCLAHLPLPLWLNEGVAVTLQKAIAPLPRGITQSDQDALYSASVNWNPPMMWDELAERHFAFWNEENVQSFWAGTSFFEPGEPNELSYSLAEVFVKLLSERGSAAAFHAFLQSARQEDAGQTAALDLLGTNLGEIAGTFLGEGEWRPVRKAMVSLWKAKGWHEETREADDATSAKKRTEDAS